MAIGVVPVPYRLDYRLDASDGLRTRRLEVRGARRGLAAPLVLTRDAAARGPIDAEVEGDVDLPAPGGDPAALAGAEDVDLGLSPLTNSMPVLRHGLLEGGEHDFLMAWVSVPDLAVHADPQRYTFVRATAGGRRLVRFLGPEQDGFTADIAFDADGLVARLPVHRAAAPLGAAAPCSRSPTRAMPRSIACSVRLPKPSTSSGGPGADHAVLRACRAGRRIARAAAATTASSSTPAGSRATAWKPAARPCSSTRGRVAREGVDERRRAVAA